MTVYVDSVVYSYDSLMINTTVLASDYCILFAHVPVIIIFNNTNHNNFERKKNKRIVCYCGLCTIKYEHCTGALTLVSGCHCI